MAIKTFKGTNKCWVVVEVFWDFYVALDQRSQSIPLFPPTAEVSPGRGGEQGEVGCSQPLFQAP